MVRVLGGGEKTNQNRHKKKVEKNKKIIIKLGFEKKKTFYKKKTMLKKD